MNNQDDNEYKHNDLVAKGACYPLAMMVWHQLLPQRTTRKAAMVSSRMIHPACLLKEDDCGSDAEEAALN